MFIFLFLKFLFLIHLSLLPDVRPDGALEHINHKQNIHLGAEKVWHHYVKSFFFESLSRVKNNNFHNVLVNFLKSSVFFWEFAQTQINSTVEFDLHHEYAVGCTYRAKRCPNLTLIRSSGKFSTFGQLGYFYADEEMNFFCSFYGHPAIKTNIFTWTLDMDTQLRVNLTVNELYLSVGATDCSYTKSNISMFTGSQAKPTYLYCGRHSGFSLYPWSSRVDIKILSDHEIAYSLKVSYQATDRQFISTFGRFLPSYLQSLPAWIKMFSSVHLHHMRKIVDSVHIQGTKNKHIHLAVSAFLFLVLDGPGFSSEVTHRFQNTFTTTTFQCLVQLLMPQQTRAKEVFLKFTQSFLALTGVHQVYPSFKMCTLSSSSSKTGSSVLSVRVPVPIKVNITVMNLTFVGYSSALCDHGGMAILEGRKFIETHTLCQSTDKDSGMSRNLFSEESSMAIVLYWYERYSTISVVLNMSHAVCKSLHIDPCELNYRCPSPAESCDQYLESIAERSGVNVFWKAQSLPYDVLGSDLTFTIEDESCVVAQFQHDMRPMDISHVCIVYSQFDFAQTYSGVGHINVVVSNMFPRYIPTDWEIGFSGQIERLCYQNQLSGNTTCTKIHTMTTTELWKLDNTFPDLRVHTQFILPYYFLSPIAVKFQSFQWTKTWTEMTIWATKSDLRNYLVVTVPHSTLLSQGGYLTEKKTFEKDDLVLLFQHVEDNEEKSQNINESMKVGISTRRRLQCIRLYWDQVSSLEDTYRISQFEGLFHFSNLQRKHFLSILGQIHFAQIASTNKNQERNSTLQLVWIHDHYAEHSKFSKKQRKISYDTMLQGEHLFFINYTYVGNVPQSSFTLFKVVKIESSFEFQEEFLTWVEADSLCRETGQHLPHFTSRDELQKFIAFLKFSTDVQSAIAVFIQLPLNLAAKVRFPLIHHKSASRPFTRYIISTDL